MNIDYSSISRPKPDPGRTNQDALLAMPINGGIVLCIADGMGGKAGGNIASQLATEAVQETVSLSPEAALESIFALAQRKLAAAESAAIEGMGSTLTVVRVQDGTACFAHVGDSRLYHMGSHGLQLITRDQTELQELIDQKLISDAAAQNYHRKNILTSVLTSQDTYSVQVGQFEVDRQDTLLLVTDGFYALLSEPEMANCLATSDSCDSFISAMAELAQARRISDDYSALAARMQ